MQYQYEAVAYVEKDIAERLVKLLHFSEIPEAIMVFDNYNQSYEVQVDRSHYKKACDLVRVFKENEFDANYNEDSEFGSDGEYIETEEPEIGNYIKNSEKYKENFSSGITFLVCGIAGLIFLIFENLDIIDFLNSSGLSMILSNIVIGGLFIIFTGIGIFSLRYSKKLKLQAADEDEFTIGIMQWLRDTVPANAIECSYPENTPEEFRYFKRIEYINSALTSHYSALDEEYLLRVAEDYYAELFK